MIATFYRFSKKRNSTAVPNLSHVDYNITLKAPTSLESPTIIIEGFNINNNYCHMLDAYYFVTDVVALNNNLFEVSLEKDVLATYKSYIGRYTTFIERSASNYNSNIFDSAISQEEDIYSVTSAETSLGFSASGVTLWRYVGRNGIGQTNTSLSGLSQRMFDSSSWLDVETQDLIKANVNPFEYIISGMWFPVLPPMYATAANPGWSPAQPSPLMSTASDAPIEIDADINLPSNAYADFRRFSSAYSRYTIYIPTCGATTIDASEVALGLHVKLTIDVETGRSTAKITNGRGGLVTIMSGVGGVPIQFGKTLSPMADVFNNIAYGADQLGQGNLLGGYASLINTGVQAISGVTKPFTPKSLVGGNCGNIANILKMPNVIVTLVNVGSAESPISVYGKPCYKNLQINSLSGFVKCSNASISIPGHADDTDRINSYLNSGFYYE